MSWKRSIIGFGVLAVVLEASRLFVWPLAPLSAPPKVAEWTLVAKTTVLPISGARRGWRWKYHGPAVVTVTIYEMISDGKAFDKLQAMPTLAHGIPFYQGRYYGVAVSPDATPATLFHFVRIIEATLPTE